jgi:hypothetical protein
LELDNTSLLILDLGIDVKNADIQILQDLSLPLRKVMSNLAESLPSLANTLRVRSPNTEIAVIGPLSWGLRLILSNDFQTPLFNNYSQILSGRVRPHSQSSQLGIGKKLTEGEIRNHFGLPQSYDLFSFLIRTALKFAPRWLKKILKPIVYLIFRSVQKLR